MKTTVPSLNSENKNEQCNWILQYAPLKPY